MFTKTMMSKFRELDGGDKAFLILFGSIVLLVLATFRDYGLSYDEFQHSIRNGYSIIRFFTTLGKDLSSIETSNFRFYGGAFDAPAILFLMISPLNLADSHHLAIAATGLAGLWGCREAARMIGGPWAGFWAALFLILCAPYYGHIFINYKDVPFAAAYAWSLCLILRTAGEWPSPTRRTSLLLGLCIGLALGVRVGGVALFFYLFMLMALDFAFEGKGGTPFAASAKRSGRIALTALPPIALAYLVMIAFWPAALRNPITAPLNALAEFSAFSHEFLLLWRGQWLWSDNLPASYLPVTFGVELPEFLLIIASLALPWSFYRLYSAGRSNDRGEVFAHSLLLAATLLLPVYAVTMKTPMYDNMRHFLFVLPPLSILSALWWLRYLKWIGTRGILFLNASLAVMIGLMATQALRTAELHPYEYVFKNILAGGMPDAAANYETEYWATAYREAAKGMVEHARRVAAAEGVPFEGRRFSVAVHEVPLNVSGFLPDNFKVFFYLPPEFYTLDSKAPTDEHIASVLEHHDPESDYLITRTRLNAHKMSPVWKSVVTVERIGMSFAVVKARPEIARVP